MQRGSQTENRAGDERGAESEKQNGPANGYFIKPRQAVGHDLQQKPFHAEENRQTGYSAEQGKKQAFCQQLRASAASARPRAPGEWPFRALSRWLARAARFAMFTQPISRTNPTAPSRRINDWRTLPTTLSLSGTNRTVHALCSG